MLIFSIIHVGVVKSSGRTLNVPANIMAEAIAALKIPSDVCASLIGPNPTAKNDADV